MTTGVKEAKAMKEVTSRWLKIWKNILLYAFILVAGIPTLGFVWVYWDWRHDTWSQDENESRKLTAVKALEPWLHFWRGVVLFIGGLPTLGYTWILMAHLEEPWFIGLRNKYKSKGGPDENTRRNRNKDKRP